MEEKSFEQINPVLQDEDMLRIGREILAEIKTAAVRVAMGYQLPKEKDSWEAIFKERLDKIEPLRRENGFAGLRRIAETPDLKKAELGRFATLNLQSPDLLIRTPVSSKIRTSFKRLESLVKRNVAFPFHSSVRIFGESFNPTIIKQPQQTYKYTKVKFMMDKVYCIDETGPDGWGSDEIWMGGISIDGTGDVKKIPAWEVHGDFDTGETKNYTPDLQVHWFDVTKGGDNWPKHYFIYLVMTEKDLGDFPGWISELYEKVKEKLKEQITHWCIGIGERRGALVGLICIWILDKVMDWIRSLWEDDIIAMATYHLIHVGPQATFSGGSAKSSVTALNYYGGGGKYRVWTYWEYFN